MKRILTIVATIVLAIGAFAEPSDKLINALAKVESNGNSAAVGDGGKAVGILQIHKGVIEDVNKISKVKYTFADRKDPKKSKEICKLYLSHWGKHYQKKTKRAATDEVLARIWNGGPKGHANKDTEKYWNKVNKALGSK